MIVALLPDGGRGYLGKIFNDEWMADYGFLTTTTAEPTAADVLSSKDGLPARQRGLPQFVHTHPAETVSTAIEILREYDVSQLPVVKEEPPVMAAEVVGSIIEHDLLDALIAGRAGPQDPVSSLMSQPLPTVGSGEPVSTIVAALEKSGAAVVLMDGKPIGMITRQDMLAFLSDTDSRTAPR
jgi:cystathionine beta-synthase